MPALQMKAKLSTVSLIDKKFLGVCEKSSVIAKRSCTHTTYSRPTTESELCIQKCLDASVSSRMDLQTPDDENGKVICLQEMPIEEDLLFQNQSLMSVDSCTMRRMEFINCTSNLETIFSHLEPTEAHSAPNIDDDAGSNNDLNVPGLKADGGDDNTKLSNCQTCNVSDFFISDMIITGLPFDGNTVDDITKTNPLHDYKCTEPNMFFDMADECMILPFLEDTAKVSDSNDTERWESVVTEPDSSNLYLAIHQIRSYNQDPDLNTNSGQTEDFDPQSFIRSLPELTDVVPKFEPITLPNESGRRKSTTLVLDLDETLVHSTLEHCDDADFTFTIFFNMKEHIVYVKQRPYLHAFLERVADMFEVVIFTASQSIYAGQLLDILDPEKKLISRRVYRESCIFSDGTYTKDLTVLGVDLAKVAIIDNSPQVFRLQVNNGIPIKSWFSDPSDCALIALLPFLEMLVDADDVRPIIAKRFGNRD
ncbi:hypothetical protein K2173_001242 [Erythroxylum novogranatense]|uniref:FCP1 homology domain-containing protein n=1 Tax=Erythroxylum novogranatense TaxID=1862640 RepID=A0AAV8T356_9ROSI|nr:hypothetical protein K2173_001242 [Erythroxylum novogranatense]